MTENMTGGGVGTSVIHVSLATSSRQAVTHKTFKPLSFLKFLYWSVCGTFLSAWSPYWETVERMLWSVQYWQGWNGRSLHVSCGVSKVEEPGCRFVICWGKTDVWVRGMSSNVEVPCSMEGFILLHALLFKVFPQRSQLLCFVDTIRHVGIKPLNLK